MNRRTFALLSAVITFTVGVVLAKLSLPNLFKSPPPVVIKQVQLSNYRLSGPYEFEKLSIFLIHGPDAPGSPLYTPLQQAMDEGTVIVSETNHVNELAIENVSDGTVFVQAGDIVKGGRQDRVLSVDFILPPHVGSIPISAFCVERSRWSPRGEESADHFTLTEMAANYSLMQAIRDVATQAGVWDEVDASHRRVGAGVAADVRAELSPTSLPLALENKAVLESTTPYIDNLSPVAHRWSDVIGFAFAINGKVNSADVYASHALFAKLWPKLLKASATEALAELDQKPAAEPVASDAIHAFLSDSEQPKAKSKEVTQRVRVVTREDDENIFFETQDRREKDAWVHRNYIRKQ